MGQGASRDRNQTWEVDAISDHQPTPGQHSSINVMQLSKDTSMLVTGGEDKVANIWSIVDKEPKCVGRLIGHTEYITQLSVVGTFVLTGSADHTIRKWSIIDLNCEHVYKGHSQRIQRMIASSDFIISSSTDKTCMLWRMEPVEDDEEPEDFDRLDDDPKDERWIRTFRGHTGTVYAICFVPGEARKPKEKKENGQEDSPDPTPEEPADKNGICPRDLIITGSADSTVRIWNAATGKQLKILKGHRGAVMLMAIDAEGKMLYTAGDDTSVRQWDIDEGICKLLTGHGESVSTLLLVNTMLYTGSVDGKARCFNTTFGDLLKTYGGHRDTVDCIRFNSGILYTGSTDSVARAFDARTGNLLRCYTGHEGAITCMEVANNRLYTGSDDGILRVWDANVQPDERSQIEETLNEPAKSVEDTGAGAPAEAATETVAE